jgi:serine/threonine protein kinase
MLTEGTTIGSYTVGPSVRQDRPTSLHRATTADGTSVLVKAGDVSNEAFVLAALKDEADPRFLPYLPDFQGMTVDGDGDFYSVFADVEGFYTLDEVMRRYPDGIDPRDMAWMYRRMLVALGFAHQAGYVHGGLVPQTVWIHPEKHGLVIFDWIYSVPLDPGAPIGTYEDQDEWYPHESLVMGGTLVPQTDIFMATQLAIWLCGGNPADMQAPSHLPREYGTFFGGCLKPRPEDRIKDAWNALEYFDGLLERLYGKRTFRPFTMEVS